jgi:hypothetical protein
VLREGGKKAKLPDSIPSALDASKELLGHADEAVREAAAKVMGAALDILGADTTAEVCQNNLLNGGDESGEVRHGKACAIRRIFSASVSKDLDEGLSSELRNIAIQFTKDDKTAVKDAGFIAVGATIGRAKDPASSLRKVQSELLAVMGDSKERMETLQAIARGLCLALQLAEVENRVDYFGLEMLNGCLKLAMSGAQRVQFAFNDVLYLAMDVADGQAGVDNYSLIAMFEDAKQMKSLYSKILLKIKGITILDD